ncbi:MAG: hypothetical protein ACE5LU_20510 [Anaerolineae bacterium]
MSSHDHRPRQLDVLIRRALVESVAGEEPPAHIWDRVCAELTKPQRRTTVHWSGAVLQAVLLLVILVFGSTLVWQGRWGEQSTVVSLNDSPAASPTSYGADNSPASSRAARIWTLTVYGDPPPQMHPKITLGTMDPVEIALLQDYASVRPGSSTSEEHRPRAPRVAAPIDDIPPDPTSLQTKILFLRSLRESEPAERETKPAQQPAHGPGLMWQ